MGIKHLDMEKENGMRLSDPDAQAFIAAVEALDVVVPLTLVRVQATGNANEYTYRITAVDGRTWLQTLLFSDALNPEMKFNVTDWWRVTEFVLGRPVRDAVVRLVGLHGVTDIKAQLG